MSEIQKKLIRQSRKPKLVTPAFNKDTVLTVTIDPWYHRPLYASLFAGVIGALLGASPTIYGMFQDRDQKRDSIGLSILANRPAGPFTFADENKSSVNVRIGGVSFSKLKRWLAVNDGSGAGDQRIAVAVGQGSFWGYMEGLNCDTTYYYRTEAEREGRTIASANASFYIPPCSTEVEKLRAIQDRGFVPTQTILEDPTLPEFNRNYQRFGDPGSGDVNAKP
jgi:hypothetical protein